MAKRAETPKLLTGPLLRSVGQHHATFWMQVDVPAAVVVTCRPQVRGQKKGKPRSSKVVTSVEVDGFLYVLVYVQNLAPATLYRYAIEVAPISGGHVVPKTPEALRKCAGAKTLDLDRFAIGAGPMVRTLPEAKQEELRITYGSCRKPGGGQRENAGPDVLAAYARHLETGRDDRLTEWPHVLLLLGDQIYADDISPVIAGDILRRNGDLAPLDLPDVDQQGKRAIPSGEAGVGGLHAQQFIDFEQIYGLAWREKDVARVLANIPTYMIFDDHEVTDDWNTSLVWVEQMLDTPGWKEAVVNALLAYWVYQGWGNLEPHVAAQDPRCKVLDEARRRGNDAAPRLTDPPHSLRTRRPGRR